MKWNEMKWNEILMRYTKAWNCIWWENIRLSSTQNMQYKILHIVKQLHTFSLDNFYILFYSFFLISHKSVGFPLNYFRDISIVFDIQSTWYINSLCFCIIPGISSVFFAAWEIGVFRSDIDPFLLFFDWSHFWPSIADSQMIKD